MEQADSRTADLDVLGGEACVVDADSGGMPASEYR